MKVEIYSKPNCSLCEDAKEIILRAQQQVDFVFQEVDVTTNLELFHRYRYDLPVVWVEGVLAFRHRLTEEALLARLRG